MKCFLLISITLAIVERPNAPPLPAIDRSACSQSAAERNALMSEAEHNAFTVRRVEFIGLTYTHDQVVRDRMTPFVQEGDLFSQWKLVKSLQSMSRLRTFDPLRLRDVVIQLNRSEKSLDMIICFKQKFRSKTVRVSGNRSQQALAAGAEDFVRRMTVEEKVTQLVNESRAIPKLSFAASRLGYWDPKTDRWVVENDRMETATGGSSSDLRLRKTIPVR